MMHPVPEPRLPGTFPTREKQPVVDLRPIHQFYALVEFTHPRLLGGPTLNTVRHIGRKNATMVSPEAVSLCACAYCCFRFRGMSHRARDNNVTTGLAHNLRTRGQQGAELAHAPHFLQVPELLDKPQRTLATQNRLEQVDTLFLYLIVCHGITRRPLHV